VEAAAANRPTARLGDEPITVAVTGPDPRGRARAARALGGHGDLGVLVEPSLETLIARDDASVEVLVVNCQTFGPAELSLIADARSRFAELPVVVVCESANGRSARRAVDRGVDGLVFADQVGRALEPTLRAVLAGQTAVPKSLRDSVRKPSLSFREKQILGLVVMGFTNGEIGQRLFLSESTVKSHLSSAFTKLGVRSRNEAAAMILDPQGSLGTGILAITGDEGGTPSP
jgi:DNA-binding NarL/FixJ family response regulator